MSSKKMIINYFVSGETISSRRYLPAARGDEMRKKNAALNFALKLSSWDSGIPELSELCNWLGGSFDMAFIFSPHGKLCASSSSQSYCLNCTTAQHITVCVIDEERQRERERFLQKGKIMLMHDAISFNLAFRLRSLWSLLCGDEYGFPLTRFAIARALLRMCTNVCDLRRLFNSTWRLLWSGGEFYLCTGIKRIKNSLMFARKKKRKNKKSIWFSSFLEPRMCTCVLMERFFIDVLTLKNLKWTVPAQTTSLYTSYH